MPRECTLKEERKFDSLTVRVRREEKNLLENEENEATSLALQVKALKVKDLRN